MTTRIFGKATTKSSFEKRVLNEPGGYWLVIVNLPAIPEKTGGLPWSELFREQALSNLTASILATFEGMSNMFLHFCQVIDSRLQKGGFRRKSCGSHWQLGLLSC
jgi:hypothetical protein